VVTQNIAIDASIIPRLENHDGGAVVLVRNLPFSGYL